MNLYSDLADMANELLVEFGQPVTLEHVSNGEYDIASGVIAQTINVQTGIGAVFDYSTYTTDGTIIQRGDKRLLISTIDIDPPALNDSVTIGGVKHVIINITEINPAGTVLYYECQVRAS